MQKDKRRRPQRGFAAMMFFTLVVGFAAIASARSSQRAAHPEAGKRAASTTFTARPTPARLARGRYLIEHVSGCLDCHTPHEYVNGEWVGKKGMEAAGQIFPRGYFPVPRNWLIVAPNITPDRATGIGSWTDAEIEEAIQHGISKGGKPLFQLMPYWQYRVFTPEDMKSIIVYLRSLPPVHNALPRTKVSVPVHVDMNNDLVPPLPKNASAEVRYGWYLVRISGCEDCHTEVMPNGKRNPAMMFAGGMQFHGPFGDPISLNITPSAEGIGSMTEAMFSRTLRTGRVDGTGRQLNSVMPYIRYKGMKESDIRAIYEYLRTVPPVPRN